MRPENHQNRFHKLVFIFFFFTLLVNHTDACFFGKPDQARELDGGVTFVVGGNAQKEFLRSTTNIVGVKVLPARVRRAISCKLGYRHRRK